MKILEGLNKEQEVAVKHDQGPLLIVAGAGTGKTKVITARIAWLIESKKANPDEILALTFTEKSANEMEERVDKAVPYGCFSMWISTFHAFCDKILKQNALDIGLPNHYKLVDSTESWLLVKQNLDKFNLDYYKPLGSPNKFIHALISHFSRCKDENITVEDYLAFADKLKNTTKLSELNELLGIVTDGMSDSETKEAYKQEVSRITELAEAYKVYQQILVDNNALDFSDLISYTIKLFKERPLILNKYRNQFKYVLVDEFQDTNTIQYQLIKLLASPKNNVTVVGDDDQSIYKFRGASIKNIMDFKKDFPKSKEVVLTENYRSVQEILDVAYNFIVQNNPNRLEHELGINKKLNSHLTEKGIVQHLHSSTVDEEVESVIKKIVELKEQNNKNWSDFAILIRANDSAESFIQYLNQTNIPYQFLAMKGLYTKPIILDIINYLKLLDNYHESSAVYRVLNYEFLNIDHLDIVKLSHFAKKKTISLYTATKQSNLVPDLNEGTKEKLDFIVNQIEQDSLMLKTKKISEVLLNFLYKSGYLKQKERLEGQRLKEEMNYLEQFFKKITTYENTDTNPSLPSFLNLLAMEMESGDSGKLPFDPEIGPDMIKIMTVHSSKGLEFDYVFLVNMVDRKFPTDKRAEQISIPDKLLNIDKISDDFHLEEERRLFYVAMTRAKLGLFFTSAEDYGGVRKKKLSRFLTELNYQQPEIIRSDKKFIEPQQNIQKDEFVYELPKRFSFSQMQTYEACPYKYKLANIFKIPTFGNFHFSFGSAIHDTLQRFLELYIVQRNDKQTNLFNSNEQPKPTIDDLYKIYYDSWQDDWYDTDAEKKKYYEKGLQVLKSFYDRFELLQPKVQLLEQPFKINIGDYLFSGRIDRVDDLDNNQVEIIDYKTGKPKGEKLDANDKRQLLFYQIASEEALGLEVAKLKYYYLFDETNPEREFIGKDKDKDKLKKEFIDNIEKMKQQRFEPTPSKFVCDYCEYKDICEFRKI